MSITPGDAMRQAHMTACEYLAHGRRDIDELFGDGFAQKNPSLIAAYMQVSVTDFRGWLYSERTEAQSGLKDALSEIAVALELVADAIREKGG